MNKSLQKLTDGYEALPLADGEEPAHPTQGLRGATVLMVTAGRLQLSTTAGHLEAERAASCLLEPVPGDRVLVAEVDGTAFVLAVLRRDEGKPARIDLPAGLEIRASQGRVSMAAETIELTASVASVVTAPHLELSAIEGKFFVDKLSMLGARVDAEIGKLSLVADTIDTLAGRLRQRLQRCYRFVEGLDQLRAGTIDNKAEGYARIHAHDTVVTADKLVKVDGTQIHMG